MTLFPPPPAADPLHIFHADGPINAAFMRTVLDSTLAILPLPPDPSAEQREDHRLATMHAIATFQPGDALEAMLAAQMVAANARIMQCLALATAPGADQAEARRDGAQATALMRCMQATLRSFQKLRATRRKDADHPSERAGYWFRDVSVPAPQENPMQREDPPAPPRLDPMPGGAEVPVGRQHPMSSGGGTPVGRNHPMPSGGDSPVGRGHSMPSGAGAAVGQGQPMPSGAGVPVGRKHPMSSGTHAAAGPTSGEAEALPERMMSGDAIMRFAGRRLMPGQSVEAAWAQAEAEAEAEQAEAMPR